MDYREAGVDIAAADAAKARIKALAKATFNPGVLSEIGSFGGMFRPDLARYQDPVLVASTDGVGTKIKIAIAAGVHDGVGYDLVAHCVNDILVQGAVPLFFLDYIALGRMDPGKVEAIVRGFARGCAEFGCPLIGGETAEMPGTYAPDDYDLAGFIVGVVERRKALPAGVRDGDLLLGLPSAGLHTNGYSLARRVLPPDTWSRPMPDNGRTIGEALLVPHRSYLDELRAMRRAARAAGGDIGALAHVTGGGWEGNVPRTLPTGLGVEVDTGSWPVPAIFTLLQSRGDIADEEMVRTFNLGIGMTAALSPPVADAALGAVDDACRIGRVIEVAEGEPRVRFA
jgi:phosphoribosylformylglycinamidine cyclo-ligase